MDTLLAKFPLRTHTANHIKYYNQNLVGLESYSKHGM